MESFVKTAKDHIEKAALELHMQMSPPKTPFTPKTPASPLIKNVGAGKPSLLRRTTINEGLALKSRMSFLSQVTQADKALSYVEEEEIPDTE